MSAGDFDFLHGSWWISHRTLKERLSGCQEREAFESTMRCWPILGGTAADGSLGDDGVIIPLCLRPAQPSPPQPL
jgi:hypothetical protein